MNKFSKAMAAAMLIATAILAAGCTLSDDPYNTGGKGVPTGAVGGVFTVNEHGGKVYFSRGNLQWSATNGGAKATTHAVADGGTAPGTWRFGEPWDFVGGNRDDYHGNEPWPGTVEGSNNCKASSTYTGWMDLFSWGTSGWEGGVAAYEPYRMIGDPAPLLGWQWFIIGDDDKKSMTDECAYADWGVYNAISNGGNKPGLWRTPTGEEWEWVLNKREGSRWCPATVNGVKGVILIPDGWDNTAYTLEKINAWSSASSNTISQSTWERTCEPAGLVFLPNTGRRRSGSEGGVFKVYLDLTEGYGCYYSSTIRVSEIFSLSQPSVVGYSFGSTGGQPWAPGVGASQSRQQGEAVRLVQDVH